MPERCDSIFKILLSLSKVPGVIYSPAFCQIIDNRSIWVTDIYHLYLSDKLAKYNHQKHQTQKDSKWG